MKKLLAFLIMLSATLAAAPSRAADSLVSADVHYTRIPHSGGYRITLGNSRCERRWNETPTSVAGAIATGDRLDTAGVKCESNHIWGLDSQPSEFTITLNGLTLQSSDFRLRSVNPSLTSHDGIMVTFALEPLASTSLPTTIWIERTVTLYPRTVVFQTRMQLHNDSLLPLAISSYSLDEMWPQQPDKGLPASVQAYVGGSDWRDDFRHQTIEPSSFDDEGEVVRFENGSGSGWFFVTERRGGAASRVGRQITATGAERTWAGADFARDLEDLGPLASTPPNYNRLENPAYPVPVRARRVAPLTSLSLGSVASGIADGGEAGAGAAYASYLASYREPAFPRQVLLNSFHPWSHSAAFNEATMRSQADVASTLGIDTIVLDDQWQGGPGGVSGDWQWNTARFPDRNADGKADIADYFASKGIKLGLWMSPAEFNANSQTFKAHPEWACTPIGTATSQIPDDAGLGVWDFTNADFRAYISGVVNRIVRDWDVHYFKFDFQTWVDCPPRDYNDYEDAFATWVDSLEVAHPDVTFSFDETNDQRMYPFESVARGPSWFDNGHSHALPNGTRVTPASQILHDVWMATPWIPPSTLGIGTYDGDVLANGLTPDFLMPMALLTHMTFWTDLTKLSPSQSAATAWWLSWYHAHSASLSGAVFRLSSGDPWDDVAPAAFETWDNASDSGYLFAFRQAGAAPIAAFAPSGIQEHQYALTNIRDGSVLGTFSGSALKAGVAIPLPALHSAAVYSVTPA